MSAVLDSAPSVWPRSNPSQGPTDGALRAHVRRLFLIAGTPAPGRDYVLTCLANKPARKVQNRYGNAMLKVATRKAGSIHVESRRGEYAAAILMDADSDILTFRAQPPTLDLLITDAKGTTQGRQQYTPDFLVIKDDTFIIREYRDATTLTKRALKSPHQFYLDDAGKWHYRAAEDAYKAMGIAYEVIANQDLPHRLITNTRFLEDYLGEQCPPLPSGRVERLRTVLESARYVAFHDLIGDGEFTADEIFQGVVEGVAYVDLVRQRLDHSDELIVFSDKATSEAYWLTEKAAVSAPLPIPGTMVIRSGSSLAFMGKKYQVVLCGERDVVLQDEDGNAVVRSLQLLQNLNKLGQLEAEAFRSPSDLRTIADVSPDELERAMERLAAVDAGKSPEFSTRTIAKFRRTIRNAPTRLDALLALIDRTRERGNRTPKTSRGARVLAKRAIRRFFNSPERRTKKAAYGAYAEMCKNRSQRGNLTRPMAYATFCQLCTELKDIGAREGKRAAYQEAAIVPMLDDSYLVHGVRPHEVCYIDHTVATVATVSPTGVELGKTTLTVGIDGNTAQARALVVTYGPPSTWTVFMVIRDYVRRHGRLPRVISVDNGKDFLSHELEAFAKLYRIDLRYRPPGMPRGGTLIERLLGAIEQEALAAMQGNTLQMRDPRLVTKSVNPFRRANLTLKALYGAIEHYLFKIRPNRLHPALGMTPNEYEARRLMETGERRHIFVRFDENLLLMTSPRNRRRLTLDGRRGIQKDNRWYRHPDMTKVEPGTKLEVRLEPWLYNVIYVLINGQWKAAVCSDSRRYHGRSLMEVSTALIRDRRLAQQGYVRQSVSPENAASRNAYLDARVFDDRLAMQVEEMRVVYDRLNMSLAMQDSQVSNDACWDEPNEVIVPLHSVARTSEPPMVGAEIKTIEATSPPEGVNIEVQTDIFTGQPGFD
ncbi:MAG: hypothetical protein OZ935_13350 [Pseudomonadota bacterium]|nr:hypothetical protein [Pseudomonadota bacterium]